MLDLVNVLLQHRCKDLGHLRDLQTHCTECTVRGGWCHFRSTTRRGESRQPQPSASQSRKEKSPASEATNVYFSCSEEGCTKTYQSFTSLQKKLNAGKHLLSLERGTNYDTIKRKGAERRKAVSGSYLHKEKGSSFQTAVTDPSCQISMGWAHFTSRKATRFSEVTSHLKKIFLEGEETGKKASAVDVCSKMRTTRDDSRKKMSAKKSGLLLIK